MSDSISREAHYKRVCEGIDFFALRMERTFSQFIQLSIATIGGFIWLKMQSNSANVSNILPVARWIIPILAMVAISQTISDHFSWFGYRAEEANLLNRVDLRPARPKSGRLETIKIVAMLAVAIASAIYLV